MWNQSDPEEDRQLVARTKNGDSSAFEALVRKYQQMVLNLAYHYIGNRDEAEDAAQKIFAKVYFSLDRFDHHRPFFPWLYRIAINQCYDELRKARRRIVHTFSELSLEDIESIEKLISHNEVPLELQENKERLQGLLHKLLNQLPHRQRWAIILRDIESLSYAQMAQIMKCSEQAARLKVFRARNRLKVLVEKSLNKKPHSGFSGFE